MRDDYGDVIRKALSDDKAWAEEPGRSLAGRLLHVALFTEALKAVSDARARGTLLCFKEWGTLDRFELATGGRTISYELTRGTSTLILRREGFPPSLVPGDQQRVAVEAPLSVPDSAELARRLISDAVSLLFR